MHAKQSSCGFTIIELLVVFAVIGVLAAIVVVAFTRIRSDARDTRVMGEMDQLRKAAFAEANNQGGSFSSINCGTPTLVPLCASILKITGSNPAISSDDDAWCAEVDLSRDTYCVDSVLSANEGFSCRNFSCVRD